MTSIEQESKDLHEFLGSFKSGTQKTYRSGLKVFLKFYNESGRGKTIENFLDEMEADMQRSRRQRTRVARIVLRDFIQWMEADPRKYTPKTIRTYVNAVQSLAQYYGFNLSARFVSLPTSQPVSKKHPWSLAEIKEFIEALKDPQLKSFAATTFQSGSGIGDILELTWGDIKREYEAGTKPLCLEKFRKKTDVPFLTFIGSWAIGFLEDHLKVNGKKQDSDPIYTMGERSIQGHFKDLADKWLGDYEGNNPMRVHSLRAAFRTFLGDAGLNETYIVFFMGQRVPEHKRVYVSKSREGWRKIYAKFEKFLDPSRS